MYYPARTNRSYRNQPTYIMTVDGQGHVTAKPDEAILTIGIVTKNPDAQTAQQENSMISSRVIAALRQIGIEENDIRTAAYSIRPEYDYIEGQSVFRGYEVEHLLQITVKDLSKIGNVYDAAVKNGANIARNIELRVSNPNIYYQEALKLAIYNATEKADTIARTIGVTVNNIPLRIVEGGQPENPRPMVLAFSQSSSSEAVPPIQTGELTINAAVKAIFGYHTRV
ncbi:SIMPL domain-containing protein [Bacillus sp. B190/17]|uniref:SIMPL domain-containing protein n=1 Tax=Bacillus lumedeiriae TaxID=3058829 RepID=A0ABW8IBT9_9BACI